MSKIELLAPEVINQIAAGEVVERPASVVKELIENSIDAGATRITIEIKEAGVQEIKVSDNGIGMIPEDAELAIARHATSKIRQANELNQVATLGFRGEALAAIASVSRFTLLTRTTDAVAGTRVYVEGGEGFEVLPTGCSRGTQVIVADLFFNSLPRRKFLKSARSESGAIADVITRFALGYPEISFRYYSGKRCNLATTGQGEILEVASILYGKESRGRFLQVLHTEDGIKIEGIISEPEFTRSSRYYQSFFVNSRLIRNYMLSRTLENAYQGVVTSGHYPCAVIFINIDPEATDVNVHPTKSDIRFTDPQLVARVLYHGVSAVLAKFLQQYRMPGSISTEDVSQEKPLQLQERPLFTRNPLRLPQERLQLRERRMPASAAPISTDPTPPLEKGIFQEMRLVGQVQRTYIIAECGENLYIIDQHAAHERVRYEEIMQNMKQEKSFAQKICPQDVQLTPEEGILYSENSEFFEKIGFTLEEQENNTFSLISVPLGQHTNPERLFKELLDLLRQGKKVVNIDDQAMIMFACKSAVKAGDVLTFEEMNNLLRQLDATEHPDRCPHGRPTYYKLTAADFARWFYR